MISRNDFLTKYLGELDKCPFYYSKKEAAMIRDRIELWEYRLFLGLCRMFSFNLEEFIYLSSNEDFEMEILEALKAEVARFKDRLLKKKCINISVGICPVCGKAQYLCVGSGVACEEGHGF